MKDYFVCDAQDDPERQRDHNVIYLSSMKRINQVENRIFISVFVEYTHILRHDVIAGEIIVWTLGCSLLGNFTRYYSWKKKIAENMMEAYIKDDFVAEKVMWSYCMAC